MIYFYFIGLSLGIFGVLACIINRNIKDRFHIWASVLFVFIAFMLINSKNNYIDIVNYRYSFEGMDSIMPKKVADIGFYTIFGICKYVFGFNFQQTKTLILIISLVLLFRVLLKYISNLSLFFICYFTYFMFLDGEQLRNFLAFMIILNGFDYLIRGGKNNIIVFIVTIIIASTIHLMSVLFLLLLLVTSDNKRLIKYLIVPYIIIVFALIRYGNLVSSTILFVGKFVNQTAQIKLSNYATSTTNLGSLIPLFLFSMVTYFVWWARKTQRDDEVDYANRIQMKRSIISFSRFNYFTYLSDKIMNVQLVGYLMFPLCVLNLTFYRYIRNITLIDMIFLCACFNGTKNLKKKILLFIICILVILLFRFWDFTIFTDWGEFVKCYF